MTDHNNIDSVFSDSLSAIGALGVDRENNVIRGRVVAEIGKFKTGRGQFTRDSLEAIVRLGNADEKGVKAGFGHAKTDSGKLGTFLGRDKNFRIDGNKVRSDFHLSPIALKSPPGGGGTPYGEYVMDRVDEDSDSLSSSIKLDYRKQTVRDKTGVRVLSKSGKAEPPIWMPVALKGVDVVDTGDAVGGFLSSEEDDLIDRDNLEVLDRLFEGEELSREAAEQRGMTFLDEYLDTRFGEKNMSEESKLEEKIDTLTTSVGSLVEVLSASNKPDANDTDDQKPKDGKLEASEAVKKINGICNMSGHPELAGSYVEQVLSGELSLDSVKDKLLELGSKTKTDDGNPTGVQPVPGGKPDLEAELSAEYDKDAATYRSIGLSKESFVEDEKIARGVSPEKSALFSQDLVAS